MKLFARVSDAKGASVYGMPGGRVVIPHVKYGTIFPLCGDAIPCDGMLFFPVQVGMTILWASDQGFAIVKKVS